MHTKRQPNIVLRSSTHMKGKDTIPSNLRSVGKIDMRPDTKKLVMPNELDAILATKLISGKA